MPVLIWDPADEDSINHVETDWPIKWTPEEYREEAEALDRVLDAVLDDAVERVDAIGKSDVPMQFVRAWSVGRSLRGARVFENSALKNEPSERLWKGLAAKCRTGMRASGEKEPRWAELRPSRAQPPRREGRKLDYFDMCVWLAEQEFDEASVTFGGHIRNVWQMLERRSLNPLMVRSAFLDWLQEQPVDRKDDLTAPKVFPILMKALRARWPDRGPGSAKRPSHYTQDELLKEIKHVLAGADDLASSSATGG